MRITKVYTKHGDGGSTTLSDGSKIPKDDVRIEVFGDVDELNSVLGICSQFTVDLKEEDRLFFVEIIYKIQNDLFNLGGDLATPLGNRWPQMVIIGEEHTKALEELIDALNVGPLTEFVLPGGTVLNGYLHLARTVCRRAERHCVTLSGHCTINPWAVPYLNRLSDALFVLSRWAQLKLGVPELLWKRGEGLGNKAGFHKVSP